MILVPGLDSTKEDFITLSEMCARLGLASFAFDGPGQGEVHSRAAALEPRVKALAVFGGTFDLGDWDTMPKTIIDGFLWATGSKTIADARARMGPATLSDCISDVACPTLIVHGKRDGIFHYSQAERMAKVIGDQAELVIEENGVHCCHNYGFRYRTMMIDWMTRTL